MVNSRYRLFAETTFRSTRRGFTYQWHTLSRSYGVNLPSSLTMVHSNALEFSSCPPELVCSTVNLLQSLAAFLVSMGSLTSGPKSTASHLGLKRTRICLSSKPTCLHLNPITGSATLLHPCITPQISTGILTRCPSTTPFGLALGTD